MLAEPPSPNHRLQEYLDLARGRVRATTDFAEAVTSSEVSFVIVPTPSGADRLFINRYVVDAVERIGLALREKDDYHLVVVTSTVMPGSTGGEIRAALERSSGRNVGADVGLCYNPEFIALGSVIRDMLNPDMLLIGESDRRAGDLLEFDLPGLRREQPRISSDELDQRRIVQNFGEHFHNDENLLREYDR